MRVIELKPGVTQDQKNMEQRKNLKLGDLVVRFPDINKFTGSIWWVTTPSK